MELNDKFCIENCLEGKNEYFEVLVRRYQNHLFNIVNKMVRNRDNAEDITQESFLKAFNRLRNFDIDRDFFPYIVRIAINCTKDFLRKNAKETSLQIERITNEEEPNDFIEMYEAIYSLPDNYKDVILLFYRDGKTIIQISTETGESVENIKVRLFRARKMLFEIVNPLKKSADKPAEEDRRLQRSKNKNL